MDFSKLKLYETRDLAKSKSLRGYTGLRKSAMINFLNDTLGELTPTTTIEFVDDEPNDESITITNHGCHVTQNVNIADIRVAML